MIVSINKTRVCTILLTDHPLAVYFNTNKRHKCLNFVMLCKVVLTHTSRMTRMEILDDFFSINYPALFLSMTHQ